VFERFENAMGSSFSGALNVGFEARGGGEGKPGDTAAVIVFDKRVDGDFAGAGADRENGKFAREGDKLFEDELHSGQFGFGFRDVFGGAQNPLTLAVV